MSKNQSVEVAAVMNTQAWIDRTKAGTVERHAAVEQMKALQTIFARRNQAERMARKGA